VGSFTLSPKPPPLALTTKMPASLPTTIFLDRDGVINEKAPEGDYVKTWGEFRFLPGALEAIKALAGVAPRLLVVSNQRGIAQGVMSEQDLLDIHENMLSEIRRTGGRIDSIYHCPHEKHSCDCRKPGIGMFLTAKQEHPEIDFEKAVVVGDSLADLDAASRLSCMPVLVTTRADWPDVLEAARRRPIPDLVVASSLRAFSHGLMEDLDSA